MGLAEYRRARGTAKRAAVVEAASAVFLRDGYARASMEEIARTARVSTATMYRHFRSKAELFEAVATVTLDRLEARMPDAERSGAVERLRALARAYAALLSSSEARRVVRMLVAETERSPELADRFYAAVKARLSDGFERAVRDAIGEGAARPGAATIRAAAQIQGMIEHGTLLRGLILGDTAESRHTPSRIADEALRTWLARWGTTAASD